MIDDKLMLGEEYAKSGNLAELEKIIQQLDAGNFLFESLYLSAYLQFLRGKLSEALNLCEKITNVSISKNKSFFCKILLLKSRISQRQGEYVHSNRILKRCFELAGKDNRLNGEIWNSKGVNFWMLGKLENAKQCYQKARLLAKKSKDMSLFLKSSINLGIVPLRQGNFFEADIYLRNALQLCEREKDIRLEIYAMLNLAELCWQKGEWTEGKEILVRCAELAAESGFTYEQGAAYWIHGSILRDEHDFDKARKFYDASLQLLEKGISYTEKLYVYLNMGILERMRGHYHKALDFISKAQRIMDETGEKLDEGYLSIELGLVFWHLREKASSLKYLKKGLERTSSRRYENTTGKLILFYIKNKDQNNDAKELDRLIKICINNGYDSIFTRDRAIFLPLLCRYISAKKRAVLPRMILLHLVSKYKGLINFLLKHESPSCQETALSMIEKLDLAEFNDEVREKIWDLRPAIVKKAVTTLEKLSSRQMPYLKIRLFGKFEIIKDSNTHLIFKRKKVRDLLKILIIHYRDTLLSEQLQEILWSHESPDRSFNSLRQLVFILRRNLQEYGFEAGQIIHRESGLYEFRYPKELLEIDLFNFLENIENADRLFLEEKRSEALNEYKKAFDLYRGPLLAENLYDTWAETHRLKMKDLFGNLVQKMFDLLSKTDPVQAKIIIQKAASKEPELFSELRN